MLGEGTPVHATAVAVGARALLIFGRSGAGKSRLAAALVAASTPLRRTNLVGDDRVLLIVRKGKLEVRPHPRIAGFIERRGLGIVAMAWAERAIVDAVALFDDNVAPTIVARRNLPTIRLVAGHEAANLEVVHDCWPRPVRRCAVSYRSQSLN